MSEKKGALSLEGKVDDTGFSKRLEEVIAQESVRSFARKCGMADTTVRQYVSGRSEPTLSNLLKIARTKGVSLAWLAAGEGPKCTTPGDTTVESQTPYNGSQAFADEYALIPGYHVQVSTGNGSAFNGEEVRRHLAFRHKWIKFRGLQANKLAVVFAKGDSMEPTINNNDTLLINLDETRLTDGSIYVLRLGDDLYAKRLQVRPDGGVRLISDNREYDPLDVAHDDLEQLNIIGKVVWIGKDLY